MALEVDTMNADLSGYDPEVRSVIETWRNSQLIDLHERKRKLIGREYGVKSRERNRDVTYLPGRGGYAIPADAEEFCHNPYAELEEDRYMGSSFEEDNFNPPEKISRAAAPMIPRHDDDEPRVRKVTSFPRYLIPLVKEPKEPKKSQSISKEKSNEEHLDGPEVTAKPNTKRKRKVGLEDEEDTASMQNIKVENGFDRPAPKRRRGGKVRKKEKSDNMIPLTRPAPAELSVPITHLIADLKRMSLFSLPAEVRVKIYRYALVADWPIRVHGNWALVYPLQHLNLSSKLLQTNSLVFKEASAVLYGDNTFKYVLRDVGNSIQYDIEMGTDDNPLFDGEEDEDELYVDDRLSNGNSRPNPKTEPKIRRRLAPRMSSKLQDKDINLNRYIGHIRNIVVEAERNRWDENTEKAMADALSVFTPTEHRIRLQSCNEKSYFPVEPRLKSMTLRVTPLQASFDGTSAPHEFTMVNFFGPEAPAMNMVKLLPCRWLYIHLIAPEKIVSNRSRIKSNVITKGYNLSLDTETLFQKPDGLDQWRADPVMREQRKKRLANCEAWLVNLREKIQYHCHEGKFAIERDYDDDEMPDGMEGWYSNKY